MLVHAHLRSHLRVNDLLSNLPSSPEPIDSEDQIFSSEDIGKRGVRAEPEAEADRG